MANPLVAQGQLNRLLASVIWPAFANLNVTASYLANGGINVTLQGESVTYVPTLTGQVTSPEPYMGVEMMMPLLKSQSLADAYKRQMETNALLGDCTVIPDATTLGNYQFNNCSIKSVHQLTFDGRDAVFGVVIGGYYIVNNSMWD